MIATRRLPLFFASEAGADGTLRAVFAAADGSTVAAEMRTRVNVGGAWPQGYRLSYKRLFGRECASSPSRTEHCVCGSDR